MILCFGDSITEGRPGVTYLKYVMNRKKYKNFGLGGDTLIGMTARIKKILDKPKYQCVKTIIIEIGCNDLLLPFLQKYSLCWKLIVGGIVKRGSIPCSNIEQFEKNYTALIQMLMKKKKKIIVIGLPYIETIRNDLNDKVIVYNKIIENLCNQNDISYINMWLWQSKQKAGNQGSFFLGKTNLGIVIDTFLTTYLPFSNVVSKYRGLAVTVDGIHLNSFSAKGLAKLVEEEVEK